MKLFVETYGFAHWACWSGVGGVGSFLSGSSKISPQILQAYAWNVDEWSKRYVTCSWLPFWWWYRNFLDCVWVKNTYPQLNPGKWKQGRKSVVPGWLNFDPYP